MGANGAKHFGKGCLSGGRKRWRRVGFKVDRRSTNMGKCREKVVKGLAECKQAGAHCASLAEPASDHCSLFSFLFLCYHPSSWAGVGF